MIGLPSASRNSSSRWCKNSHSDSPSTRNAGLRPTALCFGSAENRLFDLLRRRHARCAVVDAHIDRAKALGSQARHDTGVQDGGFPRPDWPNRMVRSFRWTRREVLQLPLRGRKELAGVFGERREAEPRVLGSIACETGADGFTEMSFIATPQFLSYRPGLAK